MNSTFYMFDIESLATSKNAVVVSVGAVKFKMSGEVLDKKYWELNLREQEKKGRSLSSDTIRWWSMQSSEALSAIANGDRTPIEIFIKEFNHFIQEPGYYSSKGTNFDLEIIANLYADYGQYAPFKYSKWFDARAIYILAKELGIYDANRPEIPHNALSDAEYQTSVMIKVFNQLKESLANGR